MLQTGLSNSPYLSQKLNPHYPSQLIVESYSLNILIIYEFYPLLATDIYITLVQVNFISLVQYLLIILLSSLSKSINYPKTSLIKQSKYGLQGSLWFGFCSLFYSPDTIHTPRPLHHYHPAIVVFFLFLEWYKTFSILGICTSQPLPGIFCSSITFPSTSFWSCRVCLTCSSTHMIPFLCVHFNSQCMIIL